MQQSDFFVGSDRIEMLCSRGWCCGACVDVCGRLRRRAKGKKQERKRKKTTRTRSHTNPTHTLPARAHALSLSSKNTKVSVIASPGLEQEDGVLACEDRERARKREKKRGGMRAGREVVGRVFPLSLTTAPLIPPRSVHAPM